jgi:acetoin utilization protein AcuC
MMATAILYSEKIQEYDLGHVLTAERYRNFIRFFEERLGDDPAFEIVEPEYAEDEDLLLVHTGPYIKRIERCESRDPHDTPLSPALVRAARLMAGAGKLAGELVHSGRFERAVSIGGGVQHASQDRERGFGVFSDTGICARNLIRNRGVERVLIVDTDAHASDGLYRIFAEDPRVLLLSVHQDTRTLYPGPAWGRVEQTGVGEAEGCSINVPLPPRTGDESYGLVLDEIFTPVAEEFCPEVILMVDGSDTHYSDRITRMGLTLRGLHEIGSRVRSTADRVCGGKVVSFVGSGYDPEGLLLPRGWLASICGLAGTGVELEEPYPVPKWLRRDLNLEETKGVIQAVKRHLAPYWPCFSKAS